MRAFYSITPIRPFVFIGKYAYLCKHIRKDTSCKMKKRKAAKPYKANVNIGSLIKAKVREKQITVVWLAAQLGCSRTNIYKIFGKSSIDTDELYKISEILGFDFFKYYSSKLNDKR